MNPACARCGKIVYPTEKVSCLDKNWHKGCFHCEVCKMTLNMKNYKGYDKKPYCNAHYPKTSFTIVADTPENLRLRQQSELQSQPKPMILLSFKLHSELSSMKLYFSSTFHR
uniref:LIM and SH3 protein 1 n=1 Tax=Cyclopterus lumpus TaxID=8103 RepID=A0A8C2Z653_CYCLU